MHQSRYIVVSGLPASGKTTLARVLAEQMDLPLLDKDDFLEAAFSAHDVGTPEQRSAMSRSADVEFVAAAHALDAAVLCSHWRWPGDDGASGTPTEWLRKLPGVVLEVHCECAPDVAAGRFVKRERHPSHHDARFSEAELQRSLVEQASRGALHVGRLVAVATDQEVDRLSLATSVRRALAPNVRVATPADSRSLAGLRWRWRSEGGDPADPRRELGEGAFASEFERWWTNRQPDTQVLVAEVDGDLVAMGFLVFFPRVADPSNVDRWQGDIQSMYVQPGYRGLGLGSEILNRLIALAAQRGCVRVTVHSGRRAVNLYRNAGFEPFERLLMRDLAP